MWETLLNVMLIMAVLFLFILPGYLLKKFHLLRKTSLMSLANILLYVCQPALTLKAFCVDPIAPTSGIAVNMLWVFGFSFVGMLVVFGLGKLIFIKWKVRQEANVYTCIGMFSNCGFIGVPFVDMFSGGDSEALMYMIVFNVAFQLLVWTLGVYLITGDRSKIKIRNAFINPSSIAAIIGLLLFYVPVINIFDIAAIKPLNQFLEALAMMTAPLSMMIVGARMVGMKPKQLFGHGGLYLGVLLRLVIAPIVMLLLILPFKLTGCFGANDTYVWLAPVIAMALPPSATAVAFAEKYNRSVDTATISFVAVTLFSLITLPIAVVLLSL